MLVRALRADEPALLRRVRLRALADSPGSFVSTHAEEATLSQEQWADRAAAACEGEVVFLGLDPSGEPIGMAGVRRPDDEPEVAALWGMWVAPEARGAGLGARLVDAIARWASEAGADGLRLGVMADVPASIAFYERLGFAADGSPREFRPDPSRRWIRMRRPL